MSRLRSAVSAQKSRFTKTQRLLIITLSLGLVLSGVAFSTSAALRAKLGLAKASKPAMAQQPQAQQSVRMGADLQRVLNAGKAARALSPAAPVAPTVTATKADSLFADADSDTQADPGDTIKYTVNIGASGQDATGVTFTDNVDPNTTFVPGSLTATPVAVNDSYSAIGNVRISVAAPGVLGNDFTGIPSATITGAPSTSANGGDVTLNANGSFTYNPPAGFEGTDTFTYTLTNAQGSNNATVTINVSGMIWFIDNNASCTCDGRLTKPFNSIALFQTLNNGAGNNPAANDNIFIYESGTSYTGSITLLNGQRLIGQDASASLSSITGLIPPPGSDPLPVTNSANATIVNITSAGTSITVASGNTLTGFTGGSASTDISGTAFGTLTISDVTLNGLGQALNLTNGTLAATFVSITSTNSATTGISLTSVAGTLTSPSTTITNPTGSALTVNTSSGSLNFGNTNASSSGSTGVNLTTNTGTITFGLLSISPDANQRGLLATDNTNTITSTSGAITTTGATAVEVTRASGTTPLAISLTSVSATTSAPNGIYLKNTSGSFTVNGDGTNTSVGGNGSGGNIANTAGADGAIAGNGVYLDNAGNVTLRRITINGTNQNHGIRGINGNSGFTLEYSTVSGTNGTSAALAEGSVHFDNLTGSAAITSSFIDGGFQDNLNVLNTSGVLDRLTITGSTFGFNSTANGNNNISLESRNAGTILKTTLQSSIIKGARADWLSATANTSSTMDLVIGGSTAALGNTFDNLSPGFVHPGAVPGGNRVIVSSIGTTTVDIRNNILKGSKGEAIRVRSTGGAGLTGTVNARVRNNTIGVAGTANSGSSESNGIFIFGDGGSKMNAAVTDNIVRQYNNAGISLQFGDQQVPGAAYNITVTGNTVTEPGNLNTDFNGLLLNHGTVGATDNFTSCIDIGGAGALKNNFANSGSGATSPNNQEFRLRQRQSTTVSLPGYVGANNADALVVTYIQLRNNVTPLNGAASNTVPTGGGWIGGAGCTQPSFAFAKPSFEGKPFPSNRALRDRAAHHVNASSRANFTFDDGTPDVLRVPSGQNGDGQSGQTLSQSMIAGAVQAAIERWRAAGISGDDLARLQAATFDVADLPDGQLASTAGSAVQLDDSAAGYGWYVDATPMEDSEFAVAVPQRELQANEYSTAFGKVDLMTVIMRELGSVYRQGKEDSIPQSLETLMQNTLGPSVRRLPDSSSIALPAAQAKASEKPAGAQNSVVARVSRPASQDLRSANPVKSNHVVRTRTSAAPMSFADVLLNIGTLPAGESVTITFNATVNNPFTGASPQVSNQGTVSGSNFGSVLTDDPTVGGAADPTVTPIDLPAVSVAVSPGAVLEDGATNLVYTFTRTGSTANAQTVNFNVGGTASFTEPDYTQTGAATFTASSGTVTFAAGSATAIVTIDPSADTTVESDETVSLTVTSGTGYTVGSPSSASGTITNDDTDVSVAVSPASVAEDGATNLTYTFTRAGVTSSSLTVNFSVGGSAGFGSDYSQSGAASFTPTTGTVTFSPGSSTAVVTIDPSADSTVEPDETVDLTLTAGSGYNVGSPASASGTIINDDTDVSVAVSPASVTEDGATNLSYTFSRVGVTSNSLTVNFSVGGSAGFGSDYSQSGAASFTPTTGTVTFSPGSSTAVVTIDPSADSTVEPDETVDLTVTAGAGYNVGSPSSASGTIVNDDTDVTVAVSPASVSEDGATNLVYTFTRTGVTSTALTVNFSVGGSATFGAGNDYTETGAASFTGSSGSITFGAGNSTATVTVNPEADSTVESDETVDLTVTAGTGYNVASPSSASGTITNDDTDVSLAVSPASVTEDGATNLVYTFTRAGVTSTPLTVNFSVGGSATFGVSPDDYTQSGATTFSGSSGTVTFGAGNNTATVTVNPETDTVIEPDETVSLTLTAGSGYSVSSPSSATGTITNDDADVSVTVSPAAVAEDGATNLVYTFTRSGFTAGALTVNFSVGGTATFGVSPNDYTQTGATSFTTTTGSVTFAPGSPTAQVTIDPETDTTVEADETVVITLAPGASYNAVSPNSATGTILNDDTLVSVVVSPTSTAEGGAPLVYTFTRTGPTTAPLTINVTVGGSATFPADYTQSGATTFTPPTATVTFGAGSATATVTVTPLTDCLVEGSETVDLTVQPGAGYGVGSPSAASGTITNTPDSTPPTITLIPNVNMTLWPPNHQYVSVSVTDFVASASDSCDATVNLNSVYIQKITSDEVENGNGDGNTLNDIIIGGTCKTAQLRSERDGGADGRVYTITFKVKDSVGNFSTATTTVTVRKNPNTPAVDSGTHYTVNSACP